MSTPLPPDAPPCASCGAPITGRFCARCGAPADPGSCPSCRTRLSPGARFCHRCGAAAASGAFGPGAAPGVPGGGGRRENIAWIVAGLAVVVAVATIAFRLGGARPTVPEMANAGNTGPGGLSTRASDISQMTPRERFDRLHDRIMRALDAGDTATVVQFSPMAIGAYQMLDQVDADARYHAALIHVAVGGLDEARALADTIQADAPNHLFGYMIRGEVAERGNQVAALEAAYRDFLRHYDAELKAGRLEYREHQPALDDFRTRARATVER